MNFKKQTDKDPKSIKKNPTSQNAQQNLQPSFLSSSSYPFMFSSYLLPFDSQITLPNSNFGMSSYQGFSQAYQEPIIGRVGQRQYRPFYCSGDSNFNTNFRNNITHKCQCPDHFADKNKCYLQCVCHKTQEICLFTSCCGYCWQSKERSRRKREQMKNLQDKKQTTDKIKKQQTQLVKIQNQQGQISPKQNQTEKNQQNYQINPDQQIQVKVQYQENQDQKIYNYVSTDKNHQIQSHKIFNFSNETRKIKRVKRTARKTCYKVKKTKIKIEKQIKCLCKNNKCSKMYCNCFKNGVKCTNKCQCQYGCQNIDSSSSGNESSSLCKIKLQDSEGKCKWDALIKQEQSCTSERSSVRFQQVDMKGLIWS